VSVRFGVIGAGWVAASRHIPGIERADGAQLVAIYDRHVDRARELAPPGVLATDDLSEFYDCSLDAVCVCTSPWSHHDLAGDALSRGVHVFCEKPMAMTSEQAEQMAAEAKSADRLLCVSHNFLWSTSMNQARAALGDAGDLLYVSALQLSSDARRLPSWYPELPGGLLFDEIPHMLYIFDELLGSQLVVEEVRPVWADRRSEPQSCEIWLRGSRGVGQLNIVFGAPISEWHVTTVAERTVIDVDLFRDVMVSTGSDGAHTARDVLLTSARITAGHLGGFASSGLRHVLKRQFWGHDRLISAFVSAVETGADEPVSLESALDVVRCTDDIVRAITDD